MARLTVRPDLSSVTAETALAFVTATPEVQPISDFDVVRLGCAPRARHSEVLTFRRSGNRLCCQGLGESRLGYTSKLASGMWRAAVPLNGGGGQLTGGELVLGERDLFMGGYSWQRSRPGVGSSGLHVGGGGR